MQRYSCPACGGAFASQEELTAHAEQEHQPARHIRAGRVVGNLELGKNCRRTQRKNIPEYKKVAERISRRAICS